MANLRDPNVALQVILGRESGYRMPAEQISGTQTGFVLDNNLTNPAMNPPGTCGVVVPAYSPNQRIGPIEFPGSLIPPGGTQCIVSFTPPAAYSPSAIIGQITGFVGWPAVSGSLLPPTSEATPGQTFLNTTTGMLNYFDGTDWNEIGNSSFNSLLPTFLAA